VLGSGTVFFSGCSLKCVFCQNQKISVGGKGKILSVIQLSELFLRLQNNGAENINLVTPTHFTPQIARALQIAKSKGLVIPVVYNTSGYERVETLRLLEGLVDIYLPDLKYYNSQLSERYSNAPDYFKYASLAIEEMVRQIGNPVFDDNKLSKKQIISISCFQACGPRCIHRLVMYRKQRRNEEIWQKYYMRPNRRQNMSFLQAYVHLSRVTRKLL
jgi:putative pyruvate formate lyase activating enzyme